MNIKIINSLLWLNKILNLSKNIIHLKSNNQNI